VRVQIPPPTSAAFETDKQYRERVEWIKWEAVESLANRLNADAGELWKAREYLLDLVPEERRGRPSSLNPNRVLVAAKRFNRGASLTAAAKASGIPLSTLKDLARRRPAIWTAICEIAAIRPEVASGRK
jgi:hypothetical protein